MKLVWTKGLWNLTLMYLDLGVHLQSLSKVFWPPAFVFSPFAICDQFSSVGHLWEVGFTSVSLKPLKNVLYVSAETTFSSASSFHHDTKQLSVHP